MTQLTEHFSLEELIFSSTAERKGIDNTPTPNVADNLATLAKLLEQVRTLLGGPLHIDSGYRCPELNQDVGGSKLSAHMFGRAADFVCAEYGSPMEIVTSLSTSNLVYDQIIQEGTWVHISIPEDGKSPRQQILTAHFVDGKATYTVGV